jgi:hypothetical protein
MSAADRRGPGCDLDAVLALHDGEGGPALHAAARAHVAGCPGCAAYLATLREVEGALLAWRDEAPPADGWEALRARVAAAPRPGAARPWPRSAELLALLPAMGACLAAAWLLAGGLAALPFWPWLAQWAAVQWLGSFGVAVVVLVLLGGLGSLALAPALLLERDALAWRWRGSMTGEA